MVIQSRRKLINTAKALRDKGTVPGGVDKPELYRVYGGSANVPKGANGLDFCRAELFGSAMAAEATLGGS